VASEISRPGRAHEPEKGGEQKPFRTLKELEAEYIKEVLGACGGNRTKAAEILGLSAVTLWRKLKRDDQGEDGELIGG